MKIVTVTLTHDGRVVKVVAAGANALAAIDKLTCAGYDLNTATDIKIKTDAGAREYA